MIYTSRTFPIEHSLEEADVCLLGIPWDSSETGVSVKNGPVFIREAIKNLPGFDPETETNVFEDLKLCDLGDIEIVPSNWKLTRERISDTVKHIVKSNPKVFPVFIGGDHLITLGILESLDNPEVIHLDAHADVSREWLGEKYSHISWGFHAAAKGSKIAQIGVRSMTKEESDFMKSNKNVFTTLENIKGPAYLTIDMDVFDPGFAPEVGTPEPLGMKPEDVFKSIKEACGKNLIGMDIVECSSSRLGTPTAVLAAQIFKKVLAWRIQ